jgi:sialate O-acetylesterase
MTKRKILLILMLLIFYFSAFAQIKLPALFTDNMVLQQKSILKIWGWAGKEKEVSIQVSWSSQVYKGAVDSIGRWKIWVTTPEAGGPYTITIDGNNTKTLKNVLIGEVWLCSGQSNMEMPMKGFKGQPVTNSNRDILKSKNSNLRLISVPRNVKTVAQTDFKGSWQVAEPHTVAEFSATAYYYGSLLQEMLGVPVGLIEVSYGGSCVEAWTSRENSKPYKDKAVPRVADSSFMDNRTPTTLFYGMLYPVIGYTIKGAIWYQGETNHINASEYTDRFATMVKEWRDLWGQGDFPFYYAQIAPFNYKTYFKNEDDFMPEFNSAYLREAQLKALDVIPNTGMAVLMDIGEEHNIHPSNKRVGGERLAYIALAKTYGLKGFGYKAPVMKDIEVNKSILTVKFDNAPNGITSFGKEVTSFELAGADQVFYPALAKVESNSVVLFSANVSEPVAVRYAFKDFVNGELFSTEGIPVPSFRSDNW